MWKYIPYQGRALIIVWKDSTYLGHLGHPLCMLECSVSDPDPDGSGFFADLDPDFKNPDPYQSVFCFNYSKSSNENWYKSSN